MAYSDAPSRIQYAFKLAYGRDATPLEQLFFPLSRARGVRGGTNGAVLAQR